MQASYLWSILFLFASAYVWKYLTSIIQRPQNAKRQAANPRKLGLTQVYPDRNDNAPRTEIDIVAIHGLDTHSPKTWVAWKREGDPESGQVHWLRDLDMLPSKMPTARIFTYDWNANFHQGSSTQGLLGHADSLLEKLHIHRSSDASLDKPIIFVASCFGGLLLCRALHRASEGHSKYHQTLKSTIGVAFMGTPFQGSHQGFFTATQLRLNVAISMGGETADELIKYLNNNDDERRQLDDIIQQFCEMANSNRFKFPIICFYETRRTDFTRVLRGLSPEYLKTLGENDTGILVPQHSACLQGQDRSALDVRHGMLNKFTGPEDEAFKTVSYYLKEFAEKALQNSPDAWIRNNHYTDDRLRIERLSGDQLSMAQCYINLAIVERSDHDAPQPKKKPKGEEVSQSSPFSLSARLKVEPPGKDIQVELAKIFDPREGLDDHIAQPRRILIRGRAGVGKTTLCKKMVYEFLRGTWKDLFERVLWVPLRRLRTFHLQQYNLEELFYYEYFHESSEGRRLAAELWRVIEGGNTETLFILDGWDEIAESIHSSDNMPRLLKTLLNQPNVIITSRPGGVLPSNLVPLHLELETIGFFEDQVKDYVEEVFRDDRQKVDQIESFLQDHSLIQDLVRIPIQLDALCYTWDEDSASGHIPETMTAVYQAIEQRLWKKDIVRLGKNMEGHVREAYEAEIKRDVDAEIKLLEWLAFIGLDGDIIEFQSSHLKVLSERLKPHKIGLPLNIMLKNISFLRTSDPLAKDNHQSYHFLHLTFQEYFAARYFSQQWNNGEPLIHLVLDGKKSRVVESDPMAFLQNYKYNARYDIFWRFVAGLLCAHYNEEHLYRFFRKIEDQPRDLLGPVHQRLIMHCLSEVIPPQETPELKQLREHLEGQLKKWSLFECKFNHDSNLVAETEFPSFVIDSILQEGSQDVKERVLRSLQARPRLPQNIVNYAGSLLSGNGPEVLKYGALQLLLELKALPEGVVQAIVALLQDSQLLMRDSALRILKRAQYFWTRAGSRRSKAVLPKEILEAIVTLLQDSNGRVRSMALDVLGTAQAALPEEALQAMAALLHDPDRVVQEYALEALRELERALSREVLQRIIVLLRDLKGPSRYLVTEALKSQVVLSKEAVCAVAALLQDPTKRIRLLALQVFTEAQITLPDEVLQTVIVLLQDKEGAVRFSAIRLILSREVLQHTLSLLEAPDSYIRYAAISTIERRAALPKEAILAVVALLQDSDEDIRHSAVAVLGKQSNLPKEPLLAAVALLQDSDEDIRHSAIRVLEGQSKLPQEILQTIATLLQDSKRDVRDSAVAVLGKQSNLPKEPLLAVVALLQNSDEAIRRSAMRVLERQSKLPKEILQIIAALLLYSEKYIRYTTVKALREQSKLPEETLQAIAALLQDSEKATQHAIVQTLIGESQLPVEILQVIGILLQKPEEHSLRSVLQVLGEQSKLPMEILQGMAVLLQNTNEVMRWDGWLDRYLSSSWDKYSPSTLPDATFFSFILKMDDQSFSNLYQCWLKESFYKHLVWCPEGMSASTNTSEQSTGVIFDELRARVEKAKKSLGVP